MSHLRRLRSMRHRLAARMGAAGGLVVAALLVTGCTATGGGVTAPTVSVTQSAPSTPSMPAPTATPAPAPVLDPAGSAADNLPLFTSAVDAVWASSQNVTGRAYIDALVAAGFDKAAMQLTPDETTVGNPAESIQFSVLWGNECLVGQVGPATGTAVTTVLPPVAGSCLIGTTRAIDW